MATTLAVVSLAMMGTTEVAQADSWYDGPQGCLVASAAVAGGIATRVATGATAATTNLTSATALVPGWACGSWIAGLNINAICGLSQLSLFDARSWLPRAYVTAVTGGEYHSC